MDLTAAYYGTESIPTRYARFLLSGCAVLGGPTLLLTATPLREKQVSNDSGGSKVLGKPTAGTAGPSWRLRVSHAPLLPHRLKRFGINCVVVMQERCKGNSDIAWWCAYKSMWIYFCPVMSFDIPCFTKLMAYKRCFEWWMNATEQQQYKNSPIHSKVKK